jgi:hypothetical protein
VTSWALHELRLRAGPAVLAAEALESNLENTFIVSTAATASFNFYGELGRIRNLLESPALAESGPWCNAVEMMGWLLMGNREELDLARHRPLVDDAWAQRARACAAAMLDGIDARAAEVNAALDMSIADPQGRIEAILFAAVLQRRQELETLIEDARTNPSVMKATRG